METWSVFCSLSLEMLFLPLPAAACACADFRGLRKGKKKAFSLGWIRKMDMRAGEGSVRVISLEHQATLLVLLRGLS